MPNCNQQIYGIFNIDLSHSSIIDTALIVRHPHVSSQENMFAVHFLIFNLVICLKTWAPYSHNGGLKRASFSTLSVYWPYRPEEAVLCHQVSKLITHRLRLDAGLHIEN